MQHHVPILTALALLDTEIRSEVSILLTLSLTASLMRKPAVADRQQSTGLQVVGHGEQPRRRLAAQDLRDPPLKLAGKHVQIMR
jgi:hypothetical protein